ncbi:MAG: hypothetical protein V2I47_00950 [Bacteroidales bacterium]|nr:hypothetical protein [Bacteroidales bacterium]
MKYLSFFLWLLALHSFTVALFLIFLNEEGIRYFGFNGGNPFFQVQGGVFHIVMCGAYILAAIDPGSCRKLIIFIIGAKTIALVYLLVYYFFIDGITMVLVSGLADGMMALIVFLLWKKDKAGVRYG